MLLNRILINFSLLTQGKIKLQEIPPKIVNRVFNYSRLARRAKRSKFAISEVAFRPITADDLSLYLEFSNGYSQARPPRTEKTSSMPSCRSGALCFIALCRNKIIGKVEFSKIPASSVNAWFMGGLWILEDFRGLGIGEGLLKEGINAVNKEGRAIVLNVDKDNYRAIKLYRKLGFRVADTREELKAYIIECPSNKIIMTLDKTMQGELK